MTPGIIKLSFNKAYGDQSDFVNQRLLSEILRVTDQIRV
jgi:hypothetical protein